MTQVIDERVVEMRFDNKNFEKNVAQSMSTLEKLKAALNFDSVKPLENLSKNMGKLDVSGVADAVEEVNNKFSVMEIAGITAIAKITSAAMDMGTNLVKSLSLDQISTGFDKYAQKTTAIQTIISATGESIGEVTKQVDKLNWFTDETSYNLTDMIDNIAKFTSSGISLQDAVPQMMGIAAAAGDAGKGVLGATHAMEGFSKAMAAGYMSKQNWKWIETSGINTLRFQQAMIDAGEECGRLIKVADGMWETLSGKEVTAETISTNLKEKWMDAEVMERGLAKYGEFSYRLADVMDYLGGSVTTSRFLDMIDDYKDGTLDLADAAEECEVSVQDLQDIMEELANDEMDLGNHALKMSQEAKTFAEAIASVKDAVSTGWMTTIEYIFGNYEQAKVLWTGLANDLWEVFAGPGAVRNEILSFWSQLGGREQLIKGLIDTVNLLVRPLSMVKQAFDSMFPSTDKMGMILYNLTTRLHNFMVEIQPSEETMNDIYWLFKGIFSVLKTGLSIVNRFVRLIIPINKPIRGILDIVAKLLGYIGKGLYIISELISNIHVLPSALEAIRSALSGIGEFLKTIAGGALAGLLSIIMLIANGFGFLLQKISEFVEKTRPFEKILSALTIIFEKFVKVLATAGTVLGGLIGGSIALAIEGFSKIADSVLKTNMVDVITNAITKLEKIITKFTSGSGVSSKFMRVGLKINSILEKIKKSLNSTTKEYINESGQIEKATTVVKKMEKSYAGANEVIAQSGTLTREATVEVKKSTSVWQKLLNVLKSVGSVFTQVGGAILLVVTKLGSGVVTFFTKVINLGKRILNGTVSIKNAFGKLSNSIHEKLDLIAEKIKSLLAYFGVDFDKVKESLSTVADKLSTFIHNIDEGKIVALAFATAMIGVAGALIKISGSLDSVLSGVSSFFSNINAIFKKQFLKSTPITDFANGFAIIAASLAGLAMVDKKYHANLVNAAAIMKDFAVISIVYSAAMGGLAAWFGKEDLAKKFETNAKLLTALAGSLLVLSAAMAILSKVDIVGNKSAGEALIDWFAKLIIMMTMMAEMAAAAWLFQKVAPKLQLSILSFAALAASFAIIAHSLKELETIQFKNVQDNIWQLGVIMAAFGVVLVGVGKIKLTSALAILFLAKSIQLIMPALGEICKALASEPISDFITKIKNNLDGTYELPALIAAFGVALMGIGSLSKFFLSLGATATIMMAGVGILVRALKGMTDMVKTLTPEQLNRAKKILIQFAVTIGGIFATLLVVDSTINLIGFALSDKDKKYQQASQKFLSMGIAMLALAASMHIIVAALDKLAEVSSKRGTGEIVFLTQILNELMVVFGLVMAAAGYASRGKHAIGVVASVLIALGAMIAGIAAIATMIKFDPVYTALGFAGLGVVVVSLGYLFDKIAQINEDAGKGLTRLATSIGVLSIVLGVLTVVVSKYSAKQIGAAAGIMAGITATLVITAYAIKKISAMKGTDKSLENTINSLKTVIIGIVGICAALNILTATTDVPDLRHTAVILGIMSTVMVALTGALHYIASKNVSGLRKTMLSYIAVVTAMASFAIELGALGTLVDSKKLAKSADVLGKLTTASVIFTGVLIAISKASEKVRTGRLITTMLMFGEVAVAMVSFAKELTELAKFPVERIQQAAWILSSMTGLVDALGVVMILVSGGLGGKGLLGAISGLIIMAAAAGHVYFIAEAIAKLAQFEPDQLQKAYDVIQNMILVSTAMVALASVIAAVAVIATDGIAILAFIGGVILLGSACAMLASVSDSVYKAGEALVDLTNALKEFQNLNFTSISTGFTTIEKAGSSITTFAQSLVTLGPNLTTFEKFVEDLKNMEGLQGTSDSYFKGFSENGEKMTETVVKMGKNYEELTTTVESGTVTLETSNEKAGKSFENLNTKGTGAIDKLKGAWSGVKSFFKDNPLIAVDPMANNIYNMVNTYNKNKDTFAWRHPIMNSVVQSFSDTDIQSLANTVAEPYGEVLGDGIAAGIWTSLSTKLPAILSQIQSLFGGVFSFNLSDFTVYTPNANWNSKMIESTGFPAVKKAAEDATIPMANYGKEVNNAAAAHEAMASSGRATGKQIMALTANTAASGEAMKKSTDLGAGLNKVLGGVKDTAKSFKAEYDNYLGGITGGQKATEAATKATNDFGSAMEEAGKKGSKGSKGVKDFMESLQSTLEGQMDIFSKFETKTETSAKTMLENMKSNIDGFASWSHRMSVLAIRGLDQGLLEKLAELGPKGYDTMNAFYTMTDDQLKEANELFQTSLAMPEAAAQVVGDSYAYCGEMATQGWSDALNKHIGDHVAIHGWADDQLKAFKEKLGISSPSDVFIQFGEYCIEGFRLGLIDSATITFLKDTINLVCKWDIVEVFKNALSRETFSDIGKACLEGIQLGLTDEDLKESIKRAVNDLSELIPDEAANKLQINSPSKVMMSVGSSVGEGLALGIRESASNVRDAANMVVNDITGEESAFGRLQEVIDAGLDLNPIITPILDLSYMRAQMNELNDMMASPAYSPTEGQNQGTNANGGITFTQNNYSPKALSRIEIYRQTKNQINMLSGVMANA